VRLELCQLMLEHKDKEQQFCFSDADFSQSTFQKLCAQGFDDMVEALHNAEKVKFQEEDSAVDSYASLYRHGSEDKWKTSQTGHQHEASDSAGQSAMLDPWTTWWKQFA